MEKNISAAILSLIIPGVGQAYLGRTGRGIAIFAGCAAISLLSVGLLAIPVWLFAAWDASQTAKGKEIKIGGL
jgi:TM2 domain-containing membrane protein YozV